MIVVDNVSHWFGRRGRGNDRALHVLDNVSLRIEDGRFVSLLGPSGCGKTTLLRIMDGLVQPTEGSVTIDRVLVKGPSRDRAMVFQEFNLLPWRTALSNVQYGLEVQGVPRKERLSRALNLLHTVGLKGFEDAFPHQLSGGMKQRVGLARALAVDPRYLLMDEPFGALDPQIRELMQIELMQLWEANRRTVAFVTHSIEEAIFCSDQVVIMSARPGRIKSILDIDLPRPRWQAHDEIKASTQFSSYRLEIWHSLREELDGVALPSGLPVA